MTGVNTLSGIGTKKESGEELRSKGRLGCCTALQGIENRIGPGVPRPKHSKIQVHVTVRYTSQK